MIHASTGSVLPEIKAAALGRALVTWRSLTTEISCQPYLSKYGNKFIGIQLQCEGNRRHRLTPQSPHIPFASVVLIMQGDHSHQGPGLHPKLY